MSYSFLRWSKTGFSDDEKESAKVEKQQDVEVEGEEEEESFDDSPSSDDEHGDIESFEENRSDDEETLTLTETSAITKFSSKKDKDLSERARDILPLANFTCPTSCDFGRNCINKFVLKDIGREREKVWGMMGHVAPNRTERGQNLEKLLNDSFNPAEKKLNFKIFSSIVNDFVTVCEIAMAVILNVFRGSLVEPSHIRVSSKWKSIRDVLVGDAISVKRPRQKVSLKFTHALGWLENYKAKSCDRLPTAAPLGHPGGVRVVPHRKMSGLYNAYCAQHESGGALGASQIASETIFRQAFKASASKETTLRFKACDGNFSTCDACANIEIMKDKYTRGAEFRHIRDFNKFMDGYKEVHHEQQEQVRTFAEVNKREAADQRDSTGQPTSWYVNIDPTTETTGETPSFKTVAGRTSKSV